MKDPVYVSKKSVGRPHSEYIFPVELAVRLINEEKGMSRELIGADGEIFDFPGVEYTPRLTAELANREIKPIVKYGAAFEKREDGRHLMVWTVRPDGDYWMDSWGFGGEDYDSVSLYTYLDDEGRYLAPFRLYSIGCRFYAGDLLTGHLELLEKFPMFARCTEGTA